MHQQNKTLELIQDTSTSSTIKNILISLISTTNPKTVSQAVKKNTELFAWVMSFGSTSISENIFKALGNTIPQCPIGNVRPFKSLTDGYKFCGKANTCNCAKAAVSAKVKDSKNQVTVEQQLATNYKRKETTLSKYGITNVGQLEHSKLAHQELYANEQLATAITDKIKLTKQEKYQDPNYNNPNKIKQTFKEKRDAGFWIDKYPEKGISILEDKESLLELYNSMTPVDMATHLNVHIQTVYKYLNNHKLRDPFKSADENELVRFIESLGITHIVRNTRKLLPSGKEIDIYLPDYNIAIEYNGVYWHHEDVAHITRDYHYNKYVECEKLGIQLITIFSNFWHSKKEIVKTILTVKLKKHTGPVIYARKCTISTVDTVTAKEFLNNYHIQGYTPATTRLGLFYNSKLVALMTFSKSRMGIGSISEHTELVRFASAGLIVGGASKLLTHYKIANPAETIISYSDNEWSTGHLYKTLGFALDSDVKYSYWYLKPREHKLYHRFSFSKQKLVAQGYDSNKTEALIAKEIGLLKVWDCGKRKWKL